MESLSSRLRTSFMVPRGAEYEIVPPRWPHTRHNLHTLHARHCSSALCHRPELRRAYADVAVGPQHAATLWLMCCASDASVRSNLRHAP